MTVGCALVPLGLLEQAGHSREGRRPHWLLLTATWAPRHLGSACELQALKICCQFSGPRASHPQNGRLVCPHCWEGWQEAVLREEEEERGSGVYPELPAADTQSRQLGAQPALLFSGPSRPGCHCLCGFASGPVAAEPTREARTARPQPRPAGLQSTDTPAPES